MDEAKKYIVSSTGVAWSDDSSLKYKKKRKTNKQKRKKDRGTFDKRDSATSLNAVAN